MAGGTAGGGPADRIRQITEEVIQGSPLFLVDVDVRGRKGSQVVDVFIDSDEGLDVAALAQVSRKVGFILETEEVLGGAYHLNVSSPGLDRPLTMPRQFKKNVGRKLKVKYRNADQLTATVEGTLNFADEAGIRLDTGRGEPLEIALADVVEARVLLPW